MGGALLGALIAVGADVLGGFGVDQGLQDHGQPLTDHVKITAGAQCIQQLGQGRLAEGHRGELLGVNLGRITLSFTRWPPPCYSASQGPTLKLHHFPGRLPPRAPGSTGRPRRHGAKFNCADPTTWPTPTATLTCEDDQYGTVTVKAWTGLHPKQQRHPGHGSRGPRPIVRGTIIRVQVQRVPARTRPPKVLWLWWAGPGAVDLHLAWRAYVRRFGLVHTVRFAKQTLGWTTPRPRHPAQADRWTWLVLAGYAQLRLAREIAADQRLPWERPRPAGRLSPLRVRRGFPRLLAGLGSPAATPKPAGCSPGRPKGTAPGPRPATRRSRNPPRRPARRRTTPRRRPDWSRSTPPDRRHRQRQTQNAHRVKSQAILNKRTFRTLGLGWVVR